MTRPLAIPMSGRSDDTVLPHLERLAPQFAVSVFRSSADCLKLVETDGTLTYMNVNGLCAMEIDRFSDVAGRKWSSLWPDEWRAEVERAVKAAADGVTQVFEAFCPTGRGTPKWWRVTVSPIHDSEGRIARLLSSSRDITESVNREIERDAHAKELLHHSHAMAKANAEAERLLESQRLLSREIDHRVKNSYAQVSTILRMQARASAEPAVTAALEEAAARVHSMARIHEQLHDSEDSRHIDLQDYLTILLTDIGGVLGGEQRLLQMDLDELTVEAETAVAIGIIVNELVSNAFKHGGGRVQVSLKAETGQLVVEDRGDGLPEGFDPSRVPGLGLKLCRTYARQLGTEIEAGPGPDGGAAFSLALSF